MSRKTLLACACLPLSLLLLGCSADASVDPEDQPIPGISEGAAPATCVAPSGGATLRLSRTAARIVVGSPALDPENRIELVGTHAGLPAGDAITVLTVLATTDCPVIGSAVATVLPDGTFTAAVDFAEERTVRVVAIAHADDGISPTCGGGATCIDRGGLPISGVSNALLAFVE